MWPLCLPTIAAQINGSWHSTIDDIPFRVYRQREPTAIPYSIIQDDYCTNEVDSDPDDTENEALEKEDDLLSDFDDLKIETTDIFQMCSSACLEKEVFGLKHKENEVTVNVSEHTGVMLDEEEEFSLKSFNSSLYVLGKKQLESCLPSLESAEYVIHRNIKYR